MIEGSANEVRKGLMPFMDDVTESVQTGEYSTSRQMEYFAVGEAENRLSLLLIGLEVTACDHSQIKVHQYTDVKRALSLPAACQSIDCRSAQGRTAKTRY